MIGGTGRLAAGRWRRDAVDRDRSDDGCERERPAEIKPSGGENIPVAAATGFDPNACRSVPMLPRAPDLPHFGLISSR